ncbi:MAG: hypothetical protein QNJ54_34345 [Prochloraceae cyanobacterium]|nr:hypothetical protein [Prochloraceae cyanobacterium]
MNKKRIEKKLRKALLENGKMSAELYEYELEENIETWYKELKSDRNEYVFVVTENSGEVAMVLITQYKKIYKNEEARNQLVQLWSFSYLENMKILIPHMVNNLANNIFAVHGFNTAPE